MVTIPAGHGKAFEVARHQKIKIVNSEGEQCIDIWAFDRNNLFHNLSMERSRVALEKIRPGVGDTMFTNLREPIFKIVADSSNGYHDTLLMACDRTLYEKRGYSNHRNCTANLHESLAELGRSLPYTPGPLNLFGNVSVDEELRMKIHPCVARPGDHVVIEMLMDAIVALSSCPCDVAPVNAADGRIRKIEYELIG
jgi:uncharacterized protein YcgI (DUF1989 family)